MKNSFIYSDIMNSIGMFNAKADFELISNTSIVHTVNTYKQITCDTVIGYYPGCFATFHEGHVSVVREALRQLKKISSNYLLVISPANSDYTVDKYGCESAYAGNYGRFNRILEKLEAPEFEYDNIVIDLNPMLNMRCDFNFTDLLKSFIDCNASCKYDDLYHIPRIVVGKDRVGFSKLAEYTDKLDFICVEDTTAKSSSALIKTTPELFTRKKAILRCKNWHEFYLFKKYFGSEYSTIGAMFLADEKELAKKLLKEHAIDFTICKEYSDLCEYVPLSRSFKHALDTPKIFNHGPIDFKGKVILDSDIYSGSTRDYIEKQGGKLVACLNLEFKTHKYEIIDFDDFKKKDFCYPYVDVAERCSMLPFDLIAHKNYEEFREAIILREFV